MHVTWTFTGDGVITLVVGLLAFGGVILTVICSSRNVQSRLDAENAARQEEALRQRLAIAAALSAEIEDFRRNHVDAFASKRTERTNVKILDRRFHVYESNTSRIGELGPEACASVVHFYDRAFEHLGALQRYIEMEHEEPYEGKSQQGKKRRQSDFFKDAVSGRVEELKAAAQKAESALLRVKSTLGREPAKIDNS